MSIGENIKTFRTAKMMTQEQLAEKAGISRVALGNYEREERTPNLDILEKLAVALDTSTYIIINLNLLSLEDIYDIKIVQNEYVPLTSMQKKKIRDSLECYSIEIHKKTSHNFYDPFYLGEIYTKRAFMYTLLDEYEKALNDYAEAINLNDKFEEAYLGRRELYNFLGFKEKAINDLNKMNKIRYGDDYESITDNESYNIFENRMKHLSKFAIKSKLKNSSSLSSKINLLNDDCLDLISNLVDKLIQDKNNLK